MRQEVAAARTELLQRAGKVGVDAALLVSAALLAYVGFLASVAAFILPLAKARPHWLAALAGRTGGERHLGWARLPHGQTRPGALAAGRIPPQEIAARHQGAGHRRDPVASRVAGDPAERSRGAMTAPDTIVVGAGTASTGGISCIPGRAAAKALRRDLPSSRGS